MAAPVETCTCEVCCEARKTIRQIFDVLGIYGWLLDSYVVDFFHEQLWQKLPNSWRTFLQSVSPEEFGNWLSDDTSCGRVWPLSLLALRQIVKKLQISRDHRGDESILRCRGAEKSEYNCVEDKDEESNDLHEALKKHDNLFLKHIKIKKRHEIQQIARICADCARKSKAKCVVDIGAGMGHLARSLAFKYGLCVTCIEQNTLLSQRARKWDRELLVSISKYLSNLPINLPQHVPVRLEGTDCDQIKTVKDLQQIFCDNFHLDTTETRFGIVGLHPCGDLAATLLRLYVSRREARFICIVGCCYMKLTLERTTDALNGYPLSKYLSSFANHELSYAALEVACHAIESYCDKLKTGNYEDLIVHAFRAALETILIKRSEKLRRTQVKNVKVTKFMTFQQYCATATANFDPHLKPDDADCQNRQIKCYLSQWRQIVIFGALRVMLAPLVETVVLLDRFLFLSENRLSPALKPIFDARLSPRNSLLFSLKKNEQPFS